jgi:hypothetical protein
MCLKVASRVTFFKIVEDLRAMVKSVGPGTGRTTEIWAWVNIGGVLMHEASHFGSGAIFTDRNPEG